MKFVSSSEIYRISGFQPVLQRQIIVLPFVKKIVFFPGFIENMYETKNAQAKIFLMRKLMNLKLKEDQLIVEHLNDFEGMVTQLSIVGLSLDDET